MTDRPSDSVLECRALTKQFGRLVAVRDLSFSVRRGEIFGLIGPDGAGKTTTFRMLTGLMKPTSGTVRILDCDIHRAGGSVRERIGYVPQHFGLYDDLTVIENLDFAADLYQVSPVDRRERGRELLGMARLADVGTRLARNLSGGMRQKLALVCALIHRPQVLFLDEPTTGVDPVSRREFWSILYELVRQAMTVVVSTPFMDEAERCDRIAFLHSGRLLRCDTPEALTRDSAVETARALEQTFLTLSSTASDERG